MKEKRLKEVLESDFRTEEGKQKVQELLHKIKPLSKCEGDVPLEKLEKLIGLLSRKYNVGVNNIELHTIPHNENVYCARLCKYKPFVQIGKVYGYCVYELYAKIAIMLYDKTRHMKEQDVE